MRRSNLYLPDLTWSKASLIVESFGSKHSRSSCKGRPLAAGPATRCGTGTGAGVVCSPCAGDKGRWSELFDHSSLRCVGDRGCWNNVLDPVAWAALVTVGAGEMSSTIGASAAWLKAHSSRALRW